MIAGLVSSSENCVECKVTDIPPTGDRGLKQSEMTDTCFEKEKIVMHAKVTDSSPICSAAAIAAAP